jgi:PleD family two-component response regulator
MLEGRTVLIVEDGNEYLENLSRFVLGPRYLQAHDGKAALSMLRTERVDLLYLDMRFDRIDLGLLLGDHAAATREHNQDPHKAWKYLQNNQGLFVLEAVRAAGFVGVPVVLAYDFSREEKRFAHLKRIHPSLTWVPDAVTPSEITGLMLRLLA